MSKRITFNGRNIRKIKCILAAIVVFCISIVGCKKNASAISEYRAKYREANLVGEWIHSDRQLSKSNQYDIETESIIEDTLVFGYDNEVEYRTKTTMLYPSFHPEESWGVYEIVKGKFSMKNDTLLISYDYSHLEKITFGKNPLSPLGHVFISPNDVIRCYYAVKDLSGNDFTMTHYLREWNGGSSRPSDVTLKYKRR